MTKSGSALKVTFVLAGLVACTSSDPSTGSTGASSDLDGGAPSASESRDGAAPSDGEGVGCERPVLVPGGNVTFDVGTAPFEASHVYSCGPLTAVPTRWFRWTADKDGDFEVSLRTAPETDDYIVEVFSSRSCDEPSMLSCSDDASPTDRRPDGTFAATTGKTYFIALGKIDAPSGIAPGLRLDD